MRRVLPALLIACALLCAALASTASAGVTPQPRIVGGHDATAGTWPALVALEDRTRPTDPGNPNDHPNWDQQICGGTFVTPQWILTAAHCITDEANGALQPAANYQVLYGTQALDAGGTRVQVSQIVRHPGYDTDTYENDVALLRLATPVPGASTLPIAGAPANALWNTAGKSARIAGWGNTHQVDPNVDDPAPNYPYALQETTLPLVSDADCGAAYDGFAPAVMLCGGDLANGGIDTCQGDSGGPLTVQDAQGHQVLAGDTSFGAGCAWPGIPGVYGELAGMRSFIDGTIGWTTGAAASAGSLAFGYGSGPVTVTLTSTGTAPLSVSGVTASDAYSLSGSTCDGVVLTQGQTCSVNVGPSRLGAAGASLTFNDDAPGGATTVPMTTAGPPVVVTPPPAPPAPPARPPVVTRPKAPTVTVTALSRHRVTVTSSGAGTVKVTVTRSLHRGKRTVRQTLATATIKFTKKGTKTISLTLTAAGRSALRGGGHVRAVAVVGVTSSAATATRTTSLTLR